MHEEHLDKSYLDRKYFIDSHMYNCPFCNRRNLHFELIRHLEFDWTSEKTCNVYVVYCTSCQSRSMHLSYVRLHETYGNNRQYFRFKQDIKDIDSHIFYSVPTSFFTIDNRVPRIIRELITEAEGCLKMNYLTGASACMRKAIYELLDYEKLEDDSYENRIKALKSQYSSVDPELFDILGHIQQMTSDKVHEQSWEDWDTPTIKLIIETLKTVLYEIYVRPDEMNQRRNAIQQLREQALAKGSSRNTDVDQ